MCDKKCSERKPLITPQESMNVVNKGKAKMYATTRNNQQFERVNGQCLYLRNPSAVHGGNTTRDSQAVKKFLGLTFRLAASRPDLRFQIL
jgi:hypothetical protein